MRTGAHAVRLRHVLCSTNLQRNATRKLNLRLQLHELIAELATKPADGLQKSIEPPPLHIGGYLMWIALRHDLMDRVRGRGQSPLVTQDLRVRQGDQVEAGLVRARGLHPVETKPRDEEQGRRGGQVEEHEGRAEGGIGGVQKLTEVLGGVFLAKACRAAVATVSRGKLKRDEK
jgi:hypothetical protein